MPLQSMLGVSAGERHSDRETEAQLQSGAVLCRIIRADSPGECWGDQLRRLRRWWSQGRAVVSRGIGGDGREEEEENTVRGLSRYLERIVARGEREGRLSAGGRWPGSRGSSRSQ